MQVGDLVKYRSRRPSDPIIDQRHGPPVSTSYNDYGIVVEVTVWRDLVGDHISGVRVLPGEGIIFLNQDGDFILAWTQDLKLLEPV